MNAERDALWALIAALAAVLLAYLLTRPDFNATTVAHLILPRN